MQAIVQNHPIVAILRSTPDDVLKSYADSLYRGGIHAFEVSFSAPDAGRQIRILKDHLPSDALVGAGTVLNCETAHIAMEAGADFMLSPSSDAPVLEFCSRQHIPLLPGVLTPSDISLCLSYGYQVLKLFPAHVMPLNYVKSLKGPFPQTSYVAVGGVSPANAAEYLKAGYVGLGIGSSLVPKNLFETRDWEGIETYIRESLNQLRKEDLIR